jgi:hypothetical protein
MNGKINIVRFCRVIDIHDETGAGRIKVRLEPEDNDKTDERLDYVFPLMPKMFHIRPKVGEAVLVFTTTSDGNSQRYYIGPVISQEQNIKRDPYFGGADSFLRGAFKKFAVALGLEGDSDAIMPKDEDIVVRGRKNAEIQITEDDVRIKAGVKVEGTNGEWYFNVKNPAYAKFKYHGLGRVIGAASTSTIVGDKILLLSTNSKEKQFELTNKTDLITDNEISKVIESAYKLPYGEKLVEFLTLFVDTFLKHTHKFSMKPPLAWHTDELVALKAEYLDKGTMLSDTVRIN